MYHFGFIIEQTLGHVTHGLNLQKYVADDPTVQVTWGLPAWRQDGLAGKIPFYRSNWTLQAGLRTRKILDDLYRSSGVDALFFHTQVTAVLSPDWLRRIPSIVSLDATPRQYDHLGVFYSHSTGPNWLENWKWRLYRDCFQLARHIVTWSEWARVGLVDEYEVPVEKICVIPPGVDSHAWARPYKGYSHLGPIRILFVGGNLERKGGQLLLKAFRYLRETLADNPHRIASEGNLNLELHLVTRTPLTQEPGVFIYPDLEPNSERLKNLFFTSDIFCLPTQGDCLPMVLSEAGAAGLPAVSTHIAAIPEIVRDGETGFLIPPGDLDALIAALRRLILDPGLRFRQGQAAEQLIHQKFDARCNANRLLGLMKQISSDSHKEKISQ